MSPLIFLAVAFAGGVGAALRLCVDGVVGSWASGRASGRLSGRARDRARAATDERAGVALPWGTITVNVTGSLALGLVLGLSAGHWMGSAWVSICGVGLLGGYTTLSTASIETVRLLQQGRLRAALVNSLGVLGVTVLGAALGFAGGFGLTTLW